MFLLRFIILIFFLSTLFLQSAFCASNYKIQDLIIDNSDRMVVIKGDGNFKENKTNVYAPIPNTTVPVANTPINIINNISKFTLSNPYRFVLDIPNATLIGASRTYKTTNSNTVKEIVLSQFSVSPNIVRAVVTVNNQADLSKISAYSNGSDIIIKYNNPIITNSIQYKFFTPSGDADKTIVPQNTYLTTTFNNTNDSKTIIPSLQNKYYLSRISQNSDGILLKGIGSISLIRPSYNASNTEAVFYLDSATLSSKYENKTYKVPSSQNIKCPSITLSTYNSKRIKVELKGESLRDYRLVMSSDGQSLYISHRTYVLNNKLTSENAKITSYKAQKNSNGYFIFDLAFTNPVVYSAFELNDNFYLDIYNLPDFNQIAFDNALKSLGTGTSASKISSDKTRYIIPLKNFNFSYANTESNAKSIKLCFKEKTVQATTQNNNKDELVISTSKPTNVEKDSMMDKNIVTFVPKKDKEKTPKPPKKQEISSMKKVVIDPGHGGDDSGAIGGGVYEKTLNLNVALMVEEKLKKKNIYTYMTRNKDMTLSLEDRTTYSNEIAPDIFVSIHTNSTLQEDSYGLEIHYYKDDSLNLAQTMHKNFVSEKNLKKWDTKDRGVIKSRFYVINHTEAPSILIEMGFISNREERAKLVKKSRQEEIADSIVKGILEYLGIKW